MKKTRTVQAFLHIAKHPEGALLDESVLYRNRFKWNFLFTYGVIVAVGIGIEGMVSVGD